MLRQVVVVALVIALNNLLYGYPPPVNTASVGGFLLSGTLFVSYVVMMRTLVRLPYGVVSAVRRYRHARDMYGLETRGALTEGVRRGLLDASFWENRIGAALDRLFFVVIVWLGCGPNGADAFVTGIGLLGFLLLLVLYVYTGSFRGLVDDGLSLGGGRRPFGNIPNLRRPPDDF